MADRSRQRQAQATSPARQVMKATTGVAVGGSLLMLSGLLLVGTVITLAIATPVFVLFSPVLVPALITVGLILTGFVSSGGFGVAAVTVLAWMYKSMTGKSAPAQLAHKIRDTKEHRVEIDS